MKKIISIALGLFLLTSCSKVDSIEYVNPPVNTIASGPIAYNTISQILGAAEYSLYNALLRRADRLNTFNSFDNLNQLLIATDNAGMIPFLIIESGNVLTTTSPLSAFDAFISTTMFASRALAIVTGNTSSGNFTGSSTPQVFNTLLSGRRFTITLSNPGVSYFTVSTTNTATPPVTTTILIKPTVFRTNNGFLYISNSLVFF